MPTCPNCGQENPEGFRLCGMCGTSLVDEHREPHEVRKVVTVLFADVAGYTQVGERLDPEALRNLQSRYFDASRVALERHGATVEKFIGDAVMAVFGIPQVHEDDALRAVRGALDLREAVADLALETRIGVNTGEVVAGSGDALVTGDAVNVAARLEQLGAPGEILMGDATYRLVADAVAAEPLPALDAKGKDEPIAAWRLLEVHADAEAVSRRLDRPLVGRRNELRLLHDAYDRVVRDRTCHLVTVLGDPGVGKSRLVAEFVSGLGVEASVARGRCLSYGTGITFWPIAEAVREALGPASTDALGDATSAIVADDPHRERIVKLVAEGIGLETSSATSEELFWAFRKLFESLARRAPLALVLDDIQWGEPTFLDLVEHIADWTRDAPLLLLCMARPDLLDLRPGWGGGKLNTTSFLLEPLMEDETKDLIENLLGGDLPAEAATRIAAVAEGNALFVEEMVGMLVDDGLLVCRNGGWNVAGDLGAIEVPPTIRALLAARLDRLPESDRIVLERAAVEGQVFHSGAVAELAPDAAVATSLMALVRRELVRPERAAFADEDAFRFRHLLIRDAAYEALPKASRAELHERFADWLEAKARERAAEYAEILGYHIDRAHRYRLELSPGDPGAAVLATRAGGWFAEAGRRALGRRDLAAAATLLGRASVLLPPEAPERLELLPDLAAAVGETGRVADAREHLREAIERASESGDRRVEARARVAEAFWRMSADTAESDEVEPSIREAIGALEDLGDEYGLASAWRTLGDVYNVRARAQDWSDCLLRAFDYARRSGNRHEEVASLGTYGGTLFYGPTPAREGVERLTALRAEIGDDVVLEGAVLRALGAFVALTGDVDEGRRLVDRAREIMNEVGMRWMLAGVPFMSGAVEEMAGDLEAAEREYRFGVTEYERIGERGRASTLVANLAKVLYAQARYDEAGELAGLAGDLGGEDDVVTQCKVTAVRAMLLAHSGAAEDAMSSAADAWQTIARSDFINWIADTAADVAAVYELTGNPGEATRFRQIALEHYERKGNVMMAERMRAVLSC